MLTLLALPDTQPVDWRLTLPLTALVLGLLIVYVIIRRLE